MSNKEALNRSGNGQANVSPAKSMFGNTADVIHDITELSQLQAKLLAADLKAMKQRIILPSVLLVVSMILVLGILPVALFGVAELFVEYAALSRAMSYFAAAACGGVAALLLTAIAWGRLRSGFHELRNSQRELKRNVKWIKATFKTGGQGSPDPSIS